jgi:hypothetical protein
MKGGTWYSSSVDQCTRIVTEFDDTVYDVEHSDIARQF